MTAAQPQGERAGTAGGSGWVTLLAAMALLFPVSGSATLEATLALSSSSPALPGLSTIWRDCAAPGARLPREQVRVPAARLQPGDAETRSAPAGSAALSVTALASEGPKLLTLAR